MPGSALLYAVAVTVNSFETLPCAEELFEDASLEEVDFWVVGAAFSSFGCSVTLLLAELFAVELFSEALLSLAEALLPIDNFWPTNIKSEERLFHDLSWLTVTPLSTAICPSVSPATTVYSELLLVVDFSHYYLLAMFGSEK